MTKKNNKKASLGCFFWIAFILLIALLFFINKDNIGRVLEKTNAISLFQKKGNEETVKNEVDLTEIQHEIEKIRAEENNDNSIIPLPTSIQTTQNETSDSNKITKELSNENDNNYNKTQYDEKKLKQNKAKKNKTIQDIKESYKKNYNKKDENSKINQQEDSEKAKETRNTKIYLVKIEADGKIVRKGIMRELIKTNAPLTDAIKSLLEGPTSSEIKQGYRSFIPPDAKLLSIEVKNNIAEINISEDFQFNRYGIEAYQAQLAQIVFTACEFPTVTSVQFLIQGQKKEYLGAEGIWIGSPLSVNSFLR